MKTPPAHDPARLSALAGALVACIGEFAARGWTPATSSNFSHRLDAQHAAITVSGKDKGRLTEADIMLVDMDGQALDPALKPSAETLLHTRLYARFPEVNCVLHTHSPVQTVASRLYAAQGRIHLQGYELLKALHGNTTHDTALDLPVFPNTQDMLELAAKVDARLDAGPMWGYLIDGHGLYAWGRSLDEARRHLEAFEFLLGCELELRKLRATPPPA